MSEPTNKWGVTVAMVSAHISFFDIGPTTDPSESQVEVWLEDYAAEVNAALHSVGVIPASISLTSNPDAYINIQRAISRRTAADVHLANQNGQTDWADDKIEEWNGFIGRVKRSPQGVVGAEGTGVSARSSSTSRLKPPRDPFWKPGMKL